MGWQAAEAGLAALFETGALGRLSDAELLDRFASDRGAPGSEAAFEAIVERHGPMVFGVCRRVLEGDDHAADDAFQATFLVLARRAGSVRVDDSLAPWLFGVGLRVARKARSVAKADRARVRPLGGHDPASDSADRADFGLRAVLDAEIARLPARYRSAVVLCYLEGLDQGEAAKRLGCPVGTIQSRLHRARERLRVSLTRRGVAPAVLGAGLLSAQSARAEVPSAIVSTTVAASIRVLSGRSIAGAAPAGVVFLASSLHRSLLMARIQGLAAFLVPLGGLALGGILLARSPDRGAAPPGPVEPGEIVRQADVVNARIRFQAFEVEDDDLDRLIPVKGRKKVAGSPYTVSLIPEARLDELARSAAEDSGMLVDRTRGVSLWPKEAESWAYSRALNHLSGSGGGAGFLGVRRADDSTEVRIDFLVIHSMIDTEATKPAPASINAKVIFEGALPEGKAVVFQAAYGRGEGRKLAHILAFRLAPAAPEAQGEAGGIDLGDRRGR